MSTLPEMVTVFNVRGAPVSVWFVGVAVGRVVLFVMYGATGSDTWKLPLSSVVVRIA